MDHHQIRPADASFFDTLIDETPPAMKRHAKSHVPPPSPDLWNKMLSMNIDTCDLQEQLTNHCNLKSLLESSIAYKSIEWRQFRDVLQDRLMLVSIRITKMKQNDKAEIPPTIFASPNPAPTSFQMEDEAEEEEKEDVVVVSRLTWLDRLEQSVRKGG